MKLALLTALVASCQAYVRNAIRDGRAVLPSHVSRTRHALPCAMVPLEGSCLLAAASETAAQSTCLLLSAEGTDVFRLALTGGLGIMAFSILNTFLVGAVARGNWQVFEDEAASWIKDDPLMEEMRASLLSNDDLLDLETQDSDDSESLEP